MELSHEEIADAMHDHYRELTRLEYSLVSVSLEASKALKHYTAIITKSINLMGSGQWYPWQEDRHLRMVWAVVKQTLYKTDHYIHHLHNDMSEMLTNWHENSNCVETCQLLLEEAEQYATTRFIKNAKQVIHRWKNVSPIIDEILSQERVQPAEYPLEVHCDDYITMIKGYLEAMDAATDGMIQAMNIVRRTKTVYDLWDAETINMSTGKPYRNRQYIHDFLKLFNYAANDSYHEYLNAHHEILFCSETYSLGGGWADNPEGFAGRLERITKWQNESPAITVESATKDLRRYKEWYPDMLNLVNEIAENNGFY
jgi:hypothetical protein